MEDLFDLEYKPQRLVENLRKDREIVNSDSDSNLELYSRSKNQKANIPKEEGERERIQQRKSSKVQWFLMANEFDNLVLLAFTDCEIRSLKVLDAEIDRINNHYNNLIEQF